MSLPLPLLEAHDRPFQWGKSDCAHWGRDAVAHFGGKAIALPTYSSKREALKLIVQGGGLEAMVTRELGEPIPTRDARLGDIVLTSFKETGAMLGVADPPLFWLRGKTGFFPVELDLAIRVWPCHR